MSTQKEHLIEEPKYVVKKGESGNKIDHITWRLVVNVIRVGFLMQVAPQRSPNLYLPSYSNNVSSWKVVTCDWIILTVL